MGKFASFIYRKDILLIQQDDGVIPPSHTRRVLGLSLMASLGGKNEPVPTKFGVFRM
jgi:acetyl-CoA carboxylase carboxyltransferase component